MEHGEENSDNSNEVQSDDNNEEQSDDYDGCIVTMTTRMMQIQLKIYFFLQKLLTKQFENNLTFKYPRWG